MDRLIDDLAVRIRTSRGLTGKRDIAGAVTALGLASDAELGLDAGAAIAVGDDCAAIPDGNGYLLFAIEGFIDGFVAAEPWFAGYCGVMVNLSDIAAMGGRPLAVVDALWASDDASALPVLKGLRDGAARYGVPIVGGHTNTRSDRGGLAVAVLGRASKLLTSFDAAPGHDLVMAVDLRGAYRSATSTNWDASTAAAPARLRADLDLLAEIAEAGLCGAAKDISMAGTVGTAGMLFECSGVGGTIDVRLVPRPEGVDLVRWLASFPSFGFLLSVAPGNTAAVLARFDERGIAAARIGAVEAGHRLRITDGRHDATVWDFAGEPLIGCGGSSSLLPQGARRWPDDVGSDEGNGGALQSPHPSPLRGATFSRAREKGCATDGSGGS